jgi:hypothetical protein
MTSGGMIVPTASEFPTNYQNAAAPSKDQVKSSGGLPLVQQSA